MGVPLSAQQITDIAERASWRVQVDFNDLGLTGDTYLMPGTGVADLDLLADLMASRPGGVYSFDVGSGSDFYQAVDANDVAAIRSAYVAYYGEVNKPGFPLEHASAIEVFSVEAPV